MQDAILSVVNIGMEKGWHSDDRSSLCQPCSVEVMGHITAAR